MAKDRRSYAEIEREAPERMARKARQRAQLEARKLKLPEPETLTAEICADPPFERSALGRRLLDIPDEPVPPVHGGWRKPPKPTLPTRPFRC
jgi:hypothetical protein